MPECPECLDYRSGLVSRFLCFLKVFGLKLPRPSVFLWLGVSVCVCVNMLIHTFSYGEDASVRSFDSFEGPDPEWILRDWDAHAKCSRFA